MSSRICQQTGRKVQFTDPILPYDAIPDIFRDTMYANSQTLLDTSNNSLSNFDFDGTSVKSNNSNGNSEISVECHATDFDGTHIS